MKKIELSPLELKKVVELRQLGAKWTEIERETKVKRRAAKRACEEWETDQKMKEQQRVRFRVAAEAFHEHLNDLIRLAESLVRALCVPKMLWELRNADEVLDRLRMRNILGELEPFPTSTDEIGRLVRRNKMLLKSLQDHTQEKLRWEALEEWKQARNNAVEYSEKLRSETTKLIREILNNQLGLKKRIESAIGGNDIAEKIADGVRENIWRGILARKPEPLHVLKGASVVAEGRVWLEFYHGDSDTKLDLGDVELAKEVLSMCRQVATNLWEGTQSDMVRRLTDEVRRMQDITKELEESLDELILRPIILRTACDLCPA